MNKKKLIYLLLVFILAAPSCTNLDEEVFDTLTADSYYQDKNSIIAALVRPYEHGHWVGWDGDRWITQELSADQFVWAQKGKHGWDGGQWVRMHRHEWTDDEGVIYGSWIGPYQGIAQCNQFIEDFTNLDYPKFGLTEADKAQHISELRTLRAWFYLFLIDYFREIPIVTEVGQVVGQSSATEAFNFIETELKDALPGLPQNGRAGRWDQGGAAALLVRLYLNAEVWTGTPRYNDAAKYAQEIIDGQYGDYQIDPDYRGPFRSGVNGYRSPENIMEFPHAKNIYEFSWMYNAFMHYQQRYSLDNDWGGWNGITLSPSRDLEGEIYDYQLGKPYEKFSDGDFRKQPFRTTDKEGGYEGFFLIGQQYEFNYEQGFGFDSTKMILGTEEYNGQPLSYVDQVGRFSEKPNGRWNEGSQVTTGEENSGVRFIKFPWLPMTYDLFQTNSATEIRLAEMYYALAECKYRDGDKQGAAELLDAVRERNFPDEMWAEESYANNIEKLDDDEFVDELGREFIGERHRRTDLIRWNRFGNEWWDKTADSQDKTVYPIPSRALNANPLLEPNQGNMQAN